MRSHSRPGVSVDRRAEPPDHVGIAVGRSGCGECRQGVRRPRLDQRRAHGRGARDLDAHAVGLGLDAAHVPRLEHAEQQDEGLDQRADQRHAQIGDGAGQRARSLIAALADDHRHLLRLEQLHQRSEGVAGGADEQRTPPVAAALVCDLVRQQRGPFLRPQHGQQGYAERDDAALAPAVAPDPCVVVRGQGDAVEPGTADLVGEGVGQLVEHGMVGAVEQRRLRRVGPRPGIPGRAEHRRDRQHRERVGEGDQLQPDAAGRERPHEQVDADGSKRQRDAHPAISAPSCHGLL